MNAISSLLKWIGNTFNTKQYTATITVDEGSKSVVTSSYFRQRSGVMSFAINVKLTEDVPSGGNIMTGTISGVPRPVINAMGTGFNAARTIQIAIAAGGTFTIRNASPETMYVNNTVGVGGCYVSNAL